MEYLLDTANLETIKKYNDYLPITGVTSNPSILKSEGKIDFFSHMKSIRDMIGMEKTLHIQVIAEDFEGILKDTAAILKNVDEKVYIKIPVTLEGIKAIKVLKAQNVNVTATAIYTQNQGFLAMEAGADFIAPYYNRMENLNINPEEIISSFAQMIQTYNYKTKILAASFKNIGQVNKAFMAGAQTATMSPSLIEAALLMPDITKAIEDFTADWVSVNGTIKIFDL
jgi:TalC/MipB family fructose-6-phosphate aldolase